MIIYIYIYDNMHVWYIDTSYVIYMIYLHVSIYIHYIYIDTWYIYIYIHTHTLDICMYTHDVYIYIWYKYPLWSIHVRKSAVSTKTSSTTGDSPAVTGNDWVAGFHRRLSRQGKKGAMVGWISPWKNGDFIVIVCHSQLKQKTSPFFHGEEKANI